MRSQCGCANMEVLGRGDNAVRDGLGSRQNQSSRGTAPNASPRGNQTPRGELGFPGFGGKMPAPSPAPMCVTVEPESDGYLRRRFATRADARYSQPRKYCAARAGGRHADPKLRRAGGPL